MTFNIAICTFIALIWTNVSQASSSQASQDTLHAEYALRWNSSNKLNTLDEVQKILGIQAAPEKYSYRVIYYRVKPNHTASKNVPLNSRTIARVRIETNGAKDDERTIKYRSDEPIPVDVGSWECPLGKVEKKEKKYETDISYGRNSAFRKVYSLSCSSSGNEFPVTFGAEPIGVEKSMTRYKFEKVRIGSGEILKEIKIEEWITANEKPVIEISMPGKDTEKYANLFINSIVSKILKVADVEPILENKSEK